MEKIIYPQKQTWKKLSKRPQINKEELNDVVLKILRKVKKEKDLALFEYSEKFDGIKMKTLQVNSSEFSEAEKNISQSLKDAIQLAKRNIEKFHLSQSLKKEVVETSPGVKCWQKSVAIEKVGLYIPGGTAPLFSTILMLGIPAKIANCKEIILCTPPDKNGNIHPAILYTAKLLGITKVFKVGGAQAIAGMAFGTESIPKVYKIFGPGNQYVTKAKELIQQNGVAIDMPAGPSEVLIIADETCNPEFVASDLLSQAEHGPDSQVILLTNNIEVANQIISKINDQLKELPRKEVAKSSIKNSKTIILKDLDDCFEFSNEYAPEHLIIASKKADSYIDRVINAGSVFIGNYSCESAGDYASGTNHTLPTNGYAKNYSGVSLTSFQKTISFQKISKEGLKNIGPAIEIMAETEELFAHKNAVTIRLNTLKND